MTTRKKPGAADYLPDLPKPDPPARPKKAEPQPSKPVEPAASEAGTQMMAFRIPTAIANELRGASKSLNADQATILRGALERELARLRRKHNLGDPFPSVESDRRSRSRRL